MWQEKFKEFANIGRKVDSMAPQTASGKRPTSDNKTTKDVERVAIFSEVAMRHNIVVLEYSRTCQAASAGMASGILGLTGISGFIFYFVVVIFQALFWEMKANFEWQNYFVSRSLSLTHSLISGLFTYILFWVFLYGMVHVY
ncbi:ER membrane protein complex subunit 6 [Dirofilaria immitis]|nr:ER membrane protein complex subunit 6 [Dirofilaria immitis]